MRGNQRRGLVWMERALLVLGVACLGYYVYETAEARHFQREQVEIFDRRLARATGAGDPPAARVEERTAGRDRIAPVSTPAELPVAERQSGADSDARTAPARADTPEATRAAASASSTVADALALLEIPRLEISAPVLSGDDAATLDLGVGHLPDTPLPWEAGNSAVAAHRDGLFRPLRRIRIGDEIRVRTMQGELSYTVRETKVVWPDDLSVLEPQGDHTLTLITCYPFNFIGSAPQRFIVHADRVSKGAR